MNCESHHPPHPSATVIFTLRLWQEGLGQGLCEWRGEVKNVQTGEVRYFRSWAEIAALVPAMLPDPSR
jgi:hypothetical protein